MTRIALIPLAALALAACAEPQNASAPAQVEPETGLRASIDADGIIRVKGEAPTEDELSELHCAAAQEAQRAGVGTLEWVGGVAKNTGTAFAADLVYQTGPASGAVSASPDVKPADGGPVPVANWLVYCDGAA